MGLSKEKLRKICLTCNKEFLVGSWRKNAKYCSRFCESKRIRDPRDNEKNPNWRGDKVQTSALHVWIRKNKPKPILCESCKEKPPRDVANISKEYKRDINDFKWLCKKCHQKYDKRIKKDK